MQISGMSLALTWLCLLRVFLCAMPLLEAFPFPSTLGEVTLHLLSQAYVFIYSSFTVHVGSGSSPLSCGVFLPPPLLQAFPLLIAGGVLLFLLAGVFVYSSHGKWIFPPLLWSFSPSTSFTSFPAPGCWVRAPAPSLSGQPRLVYLQFREGSPLLLFGAQVAPPSLLRVFIVLIAYYPVFLFFPGWVSVCPGGYADLAQGCLWKYCVLLNSPCAPRLPKLSGHRCLAVAWGPSWFLCSM
jgi:hypothetical protein